MGTIAYFRVSRIDQNVEKNKPEIEALLANSSTKRYRTTESKLHIWLNKFF